MSPNSARASGLRWGKTGARGSGRQYEAEPGRRTWVCWQGLKSAVRKRSGSAPAPAFGLLTLAAAAGLGFGALNEVIEFVATLTMPETNVGGYVNTGWDLVANTVGAVAAVVLIRFFDRGERRG